ncbi:MAG: hypothetical protein HPY59_16970 [Anaerolineae bacterium]|nr:hypothetical protein [Anaerolineae bacterium]
MSGQAQEGEAGKLRWRGVIALAPITLDAAVTTRVEELLTKNGLKVTKWYHVSLRLLSLERQLEEAAGFLPEIAARQPAFKIRVTGTAFFPSAGALTLKVQPATVLKGLRREILLRQRWPGALAWLRNLTWIPHISAAYEVGENGWALAHELAAIAQGQEALVEQITLRNWRDQDRCYRLGSGEESCVPLME